MSWLPYVTMFLLMVVGLFMIFIILLQRGRGGGLAGALGGMGGTSAFGTRAGDVFTKITIVVAIVWTVLAAVNVWVLGMNTTRFKGGTQAVPTAPALQAKPGAEDESAEDMGAGSRSDALPAEQGSGSSPSSGTAAAAPAGPSEPSEAESKPPAEAQPATESKTPAAQEGAAASENSSAKPPE